MSEEKKIIEKINQTFEEFKSRNDLAIAEAEKRNGEATAETRGMVESLNTAIKELRIELSKVIKERKAYSISMQNKTDPETEKRIALFEKFVRYGMGETGRTHWSPEETALVFDNERRDLTGVNDASGGFLVPPEISNVILMKAYNIAEVRPYCNVGTTSRDSVWIPSMKKPAVVWGHAAVPVPQQTDLQAGHEMIHVRPLTALQAIPSDTLEDVASDVMTQLQASFAMAMAEAEDDGFIVGDGVDAPLGVLNNTTVQANFVKTNVAGALYDSTYNGVDAVISLLHKPKKAYRKNGVFAMNSTTESALRQLKDKDGQYLWQPSVQAGSPASLLGRPIINPEGMPDVAANAFPLLFGDFQSGFWIRDRQGMRVQRLVEKFVEYRQTGIMVSKRVGAGVVMPEAFAVLKVAA